MMKEQRLSKEDYTGVEKQWVLNPNEVYEDVLEVMIFHHVQD